MKSFNSMLIILSLLSFCVNLSFSQENDSLKNYSFNEVIISASRNEQNVMSTGKAVIVITAEQLTKYINFSLGDILEKEAGIYLTGTGQIPGANQRLFIRGSNSNHLTLMIDGLKISDPSSVDNGIDLSEIALSDIQQIEIVKGSHSTYFGSSSIGGIVNIITKKNKEDKSAISVNLTTGLFGRQGYLSDNDISLNFSHKSGLFAETGIHGTLCNGFDATLDTVTNPAAYNNRDDDGYNYLSYFGKIGFKNKNLNTFINFRDVYQKSFLDKGAFKDDDNRYIVFSRKLINWSSSYRFNPSIDIVYSGGYSIMQRTDIDDSSVVDNIGTFDHTYAKSTFDGLLYSNELLLNVMRNYIRFAVGVSQQTEKMNNINYIYSWSPFYGIYENNYNLDSLDLSSTSLAGFLHFSMSGKIFSNKLEALKVEGGIRVSNHSGYGNIATFNFNPSWKITNTSLLFLSFATGFNSPSLYRLYSPDKGWGAIVSRGNPNLKPERSKSFELGFKESIHQSAFFEAVLFHNNVKDIIEYVYLWDKNIDIDSLGNDWMRNDYRGDTYINLSEQNIFGVEFRFKSHLNQFFDFTGNFSFINATSPVSIANIDTSLTKGNHVQLFESGIFINEKSYEKIGLVRRPDAVVFLSLSYHPIAKLNISINTKFVGHRYDSYYNPTLGPYGALDNDLIKGYNLTDIQVKYKFGKKISAIVKIENLLNSRYMEINGFSTRPRGIFLNISYQ